MSIEDMPDPPEKPGVFGYAQYLWYYAAREGSVIRRAPFSFVVAMLVVGAPIYWLRSSMIRDEYTGQIDDLKAANEQLDAAEKTLQATIEFQDRRMASGLGSQPAPLTAGTSRIQFMGANRLPPLFPVRINMYYINKGNIPAIGTMFVGDSVFAEKKLTNAELDILFETLRTRLKAILENNSTYEVQSGTPIFNTIVATNISQEQVNEFPFGRETLYSYAIQQYRDENTPPGKWRVTEVCLFAPYGSADHLCEIHNRIYLSD